MYRFLFTLLILTLSFGNFKSAFAQDSTKVEMSYGSKGFELKTSDGNYKFQIQPRLQFRYATPFDSNPTSVSNLTSDPRQVFKIRRARLKIGGNAYQPFLKYYLEADLLGGSLLNYTVMIEKWRGFNFKIGQWKIEHNRERVISSGKQGLVGRSILNKYFTLDRQQGMAVYGNFGNASAANFSYVASVLTGAGRSAKQNTTNDLMYNARLQWNFLGKEMPVQSSDTKKHQNGVGAIAVSAAAFKSPANLFSSSGGSDYFGAPDSITPIYSVQQLNFETAFMKKGFSWQTETHVKQIVNERTDANQSFAGTYVQVGYFFNQIMAQIPENLEIVARYAAFTPNFDTRETIHNEYSLGVNYFFEGHKNKLTAEVSNFSIKEPMQNLENRYRFRIQWDISF